jgi:putative PIN family toxin of toxin-antitoxin system
VRCVFDTNVLISALLLPDSKPRRALDLALRSGKILLAFSIVVELYDILSRKQFRRYVGEEDIRTFLAALTREAEWVDPLAPIRACRDPKDDKFLEVAVTGGAGYIVTGDPDLLALHPFRGIQVLSPRSFLELHIVANSERGGRLWIEPQMRW